VCYLRCGSVGYFSCSWGHMRRGREESQAVFPMAPSATKDRAYRFPLRSIDRDPTAEVAPSLHFAFLMSPLSLPSPDPHLLLPVPVTAPQAPSFNIHLSLFTNKSPISQTGVMTRRIPRIVCYSGQRRRQSTEQLRTTCAMHCDAAQGRSTHCKPPLLVPPPTLTHLT
jgi:hypothetical protein